MARPRRSFFGPSEQAVLLDVLGVARHELTRLCAAVSPNSDRYRRCQAVMKAIDDLAGDETYEAHN